MMRGWTDSLAVLAALAWAGGAQANPFMTEGSVAVQVPGSFRVQVRVLAFERTGFLPPRDLVLRWE
jgi:hypothetical protein